VTRHGEDEVGAGSSGELGLGAEQREMSTQMVAVVLEQRRKQWDENGLEFAASGSKKKIPNWIRRKKGGGG
jgi:hypothetical protein